MNPTTGHPLDCACCRISITRTSGPKRTREDADLSTFLPEDPPEEEEGGEEDEEEDEEEEEGQEDSDALINDALCKSFAKHVEDLDAARRRRIETLSFKSALEDDGTEEVNQDANQDEVDGLGVWLPGDEFQGDVNYRTLQKLLTRVDQRGFERSAQQLEASRPAWRLPCPASHALSAHAQFHIAFMKAAARVIYRGSWETERPAIMKRFGWEKSNSEVLIRCALNPPNNPRTHEPHQPLPTPVHRLTATRNLCLRAQHASPLRKDLLVRPPPAPPACARSHSHHPRARLAASPSSARASRSPLASRLVRRETRPPRLVSAHSRAPSARSRLLPSPSRVAQAPRADCRVPSAV